MQGPRCVRCGREQRQPHACLDLLAVLERLEQVRATVPVLGASIRFYEEGPAEDLGALVRLYANVYTVRQALNRLVMDLHDLEAPLQRALVGHGRKLFELGTVVPREGEADGP